MAGRVERHPHLLSQADSRHRTRHQSGAHRYDDPKKADSVRRLLGGFLLPFASRTASRERLHVFTTNYDRVVEYGCDLLGLRVLDRFLGNLSPVFRSSRLGVDLHYNPPGIRGEPRYLEGVVRLTKLHGSLDWSARAGTSGRAEVQRCALSFGAAESHPEVSDCPGASVLVYPNASKDAETLEYPYADLFRDFAAATCRSNSVVVTYGYGFGDDHVNRVLSDMLTIPSKHLVIMSYDDAAVVLLPSVAQAQSRGRGNGKIIIGVVTISFGATLMARSWTRDRQVTRGLVAGAVIGTGGLLLLHNGLMDRRRARRPSPFISINALPRGVQVGFSRSW